MGNFKTHIVFNERDTGAECFNDIFLLKDHCDLLEEEGVDYTIFELGKRVGQIDAIDLNDTIAEDSSEDDEEGDCDGLDG